MNSQLPVAMHHTSVLKLLLLSCLEAEKVAQVSKIQWEQKITEKESQKKISEIEGMLYKMIIYR